MSNDVVLVGRAELDSIFQSLKKMTDQAKSANDQLSTFGKNTQDTLSKATKKTENDIKQTGSALRRLASQLYSDFKGLMALESLQAGLKLSSQFKGAVKESITLSDTIRRVGSSFNIARGDFGKFQSSLARGLGDIGASSESAAAALEGLTGMGVKGQGSAMNLAKGAVTLAGMSGEKGNERSIASLLGKTLHAQGKDVNDMSAQNALIGEVTAAVTATGKQSSEILGAMEQIFGTMDKTMRGRVGVQGMAQMATMAATVGPAATKALQEYFAKGAVQRLPLEAQGFNIFGKDGGIDLKALKSFVDTTRGRIGGDPRASLMTAGFSDEAADGLIKLADHSSHVTDNLDKLSAASRDNEAAFKASLGLLDSFKGTINTVKGRLEQLTEGWTQKLTDIISGQIGDAGGSAAVVGGAGVLAAILAGGGLRGIGGMLGGAAKKKGYETVTGEKVQNVYVVNADQIGKSLTSVAGGAASVGGGLGGKLKTAGMAVGVAAAGYALGEQVVNPLLDKTTQGKTSEGFEGNAAERFFFKMDKFFGGDASKNFMQQNVKVVVDSRDPNLKAKSEVSRGTSN